MKIALSGYGKMGKLIEEQAQQRGHEITLRLCGDNNSDAAGLTAAALKGSDICIDFSVPEAVLSNVRAVVAAGLPIVVGTTGWTNNLSIVKDFVVNHNGALVYGSNFSFGMNLFFRIVENAARLFAASQDYDIFMIEQHHKWKKDAPSGTALTLKSILTKQMPERDCQISSVRAGHAAGLHEIGFDSQADTITLTHNARNRSGFAAGAVMAAEWVIGKHGVFEFQEIIGNK
jgi:4-hydroxy-tetrahydrodipicolinate reductase